MNEFMTDEEVAKALGLQPKEVRRMIRAGHLPGRTIKRGHTITMRADLEKWFTQKQNEDKKEASICAKTDANRNQNHEKAMEQSGAVHIHRRPEIPSENIPRLPQNGAEKGEDKDVARRDNAGTSTSTSRRASNENTDPEKDRQRLLRHLDRTAQ